MYEYLNVLLVVIAKSTESYSLHNGLFPLVVLILEHDKPFFICVRMYIKNIHNDVSPCSTNKNHIYRN